ncbi:MAG: hypothetical protein JWP02_1398 [Acidimicrobiales bacterium]|nr:hypothetical protein [Acidimicrobiales bacterium]
MSRDRVGELIELGLDRQAAELAVREALETDAEEADVSPGSVERSDVVIPPATAMVDDADPRRP